LIEIPKGMAARENRVQEISVISRGLKQLARELSVPIIALSQLNRAVENAPQCIPQLSHLRESGSIEQDAHNVLMLWREGYYNEHAESPDLTTVFIRKNRQGPVGTAELVFDKELMRFTPLQR
jgi:replicative DNA helicase